MTGVNVERLHFLLKVAGKETAHLLETTKRLSQENINKIWVEQLEKKPDLAERIDAFVARFGRLQDHLGDKLTPELLRQMLEVPSSAIDNLNKMEKLGLLSSMLDWVEARNLRNRLVHEYVEDPEEFASAINRAIALVPLLVETSKNFTEYAARFLKD
jgi:uncharacterized protein with HEPN domain